MAQFVHENFAIDEEVDQAIQQLFDELVSKEIEELKHLNLDEDTTRAMAVENVFITKEKCKLKLKRDAKTYTEETSSDNEKPKRRFRRKGTREHLWVKCLIRQHKRRERDVEANREFKENVAYAVSQMTPDPSFMHKNFAIDAKIDQEAQRYFDVLVDNRMRRLEHLSMNELTKRATAVDSIFVFKEHVKLAMKQKAATEVKETGKKKEAPKKTFKVMGITEPHPEDKESLLIKCLRNQHKKRQENAQNAELGKKAEEN